MFTGLIRDIGTVTAVNDNGGDRRLEIETGLDLEPVQIGASVSCSGVCLTVVEKNGRRFAVDVSGETLSKTAIDQWNEGGRVNLEPSLRLGDELGGHFVFGHVDGLATLQSIEPDGESHRLAIAPPKALLRFIAPKGSVALDGVSLTVNEVHDDSFGVNIIAHTWKHTTLGEKKTGDKLHIEVDMLARYVARMQETDR